jgi:phage terminase large subunit-like protein
MARRPKIVSPQEILVELTEGLRKVAINPSIAAYKPLPHQERFHQSGAQGKLFIGGNRSGKTVGGGTESVWWLTGRHPFRKLKTPPIHGRIVAVDFDQGVEKIVKPEVKKWIPPSLLINGSWEESYQKALRTLVLANGSTVEFMSYDQDVAKFAGTSRDFVWFDEECPEDIFNECMLRLVDVAGSWWMTMTPLIDMSWTFDRIYDPWKTKQAKDYDVFEVDTSENTYVSADILELALKGLSDGERAARKAGRYISHTGLVYKLQRSNIIDDVFSDPIKWNDLRTNWGHFAMLDHGLNNPTCILFACYDTEGRIIIYDEIYQSGKLIHENAKDYLARVEVLQAPIGYLVGDPSIKNRDPITGTSILQEYADYGVYISLANNDLRGGISRVQNRLSRECLFITERCEKLLWEFPRYRWDKYASSKLAQRKNPKEAPMKKDDHALDALRYGVASRPALDDEIDMPMENVLNLPVALSSVDTNYAWAMIEQEKDKVQMDDYLGSSF